MENKLEAALALATRGFYVFPVAPNSKIPVLKDFPNKCSRDPEQIKDWFGSRDFNIGISASKFGDDGHYLCVVDVDNKGEKKGGDELLRLELEGKNFPFTFTQKTPTGGEHFFYKSRVKLKQGVSNLAPGIDTRTPGGYVVGASSTINGFPYEITNSGEVLDAPEWMIEELKDRAPIPLPIRSPALTAIGNVDQVQAINRAVEFLLKVQPITEGQRNHALFSAAARLKDLGVNAPTAIHLLLEHWNDKCHPPLSVGEIQKTVGNVYVYGKNPIGAATPQAEFAGVQPPAIDDDTLFSRDPVGFINRNFAFVLIGTKHLIIHETGTNFSLLQEVSFHKLLASRTHRPEAAGRDVPATRTWMKDDRRRSYSGLCFCPGREKIVNNEYNLWRGFAVGTAAVVTEKGKKSLETLLEHAKENICDGNDEHFLWLIGYFAHLIQRPWERPNVAIVFRGAKGVGKNAFIDRIKYLLGRHALLASNRRYLTGNFNSHLENLVLFILDEAYWAGDKQTNGILKDLITGDFHVIERKGFEPYPVNNCLRVVIMGNEDWLIPASADERRYAVFNVGEKKKQNIPYFKEMREGMEEGGYSLLLNYLKTFDISNFNVHQAPQTKGLRDQKNSSLEPVEDFWVNNLMEGRIASFEKWPDTITNNDFLIAFGDYCRLRNIRSRHPTPQQIKKHMSLFCPDARVSRNMYGKCYRLPPIKECRKLWEKYIGHEEDWGVESGQIEDLF